MNIVKAIFSGGCTQITAAGALWQWDQGQILQIVGLDLPDAYQVEFSNQPGRGTAAPMIGGVDGVEIPDVYLATGKPVYAFVVLHAGEDDRETEYKITIPVNARPQPTDVQPTPEQQSVIDQLIAALNAGVEKAEDAAAAAEEARDKMPRIVDGTWRVYNAVTESWEDTGIQAEGQDGVGISGAVLNADYTLTLTFTDGSSYTTPPIRGAQGERGPIGPTPDISIGTVTTGAAGSQAEATMTGTPERPVLNLTIPRGDPGEVTQAEFDDLADEVSRQKSAIDDLTALTNRKAGMLIDTASGSIASFVPDSTIPNLLGMTVDIEPVQDLHGYDAPWPAGGGVNKFGDYTIVNGYITSSGEIASSAENRTYVIPISAETTYSIKIARTVATGSTSNDDVQIGEFYGDERPVAGSSGGTRLKAGGYVNNLYTATFATGANAKWLAIKIGRTTVTNVEATAATVQLEIGSSVSAEYTPYENICPISGWDAVEVEATGINVWDEEWEAGGISDTTGEKIPQSSRIRSKNYIPCVPNMSYCLVSPLTSNDVRIAYYRADFSFISMTPWTVNGAFTTNASAHYMMFFTAGAYGNTYHNDISINYPSTDTAYHPYAGNRYTITLGDTVYGGTLTISEDGSVNALVDRATDKISDLVCSKSVSNYQTFVVTPTHEMASGERIALVQSSSWRGLSQYQMTSSDDNYVWGSSVNGTIRIKTTAYASLTASEFKEMFADAQLCYLLATPITIQIDPVTIAAIANQTNNVWADAGDVSVEFAADLKHYIDSKIAAAVAALS